MKGRINFAVDKMSVLCNIMDGEIKARMDSKNNPERKKHYKELGIIDTVPAITTFMHNHPNIFSNKKFIKTNRNIFEEILTVSSDYGKYVYIKEVARILEYTYDLSKKEKSDINLFLADFWDLSESEEFQKIIEATEVYKNSIEKIWRQNEEFALSWVKKILGYDPEMAGTVCTYIMYPNFNIHRTCQTKVNQTNLFFGKMKEKNPNKIVAYLTHQVVHQPMLPYKSTMTKKQKEEFHAFIKFLTDKEIYNKLTGKSILDIVTQNENSEAMARVYPYWLGYRYRNVEKEGKESVIEIARAIQRDKRYYDRLPETSKKKQLYRNYQFEKLDALKIAEFFREKKGMTPYQFAEIDFDNRERVCKVNSRVHV